MSAIEALQILAVLGIWAFVISLLINFVRPYKIGYGWYFACALVITCVAICGYNFTPSFRLDIYRLSFIIDKMRINSQTLIEALTAVDDDYKGLYFFRFLCFLVSKTDNNQWLSVASIVITLGLVSTVIIDYLRSRDYRSNAIMIAIMITFMGMQMQYIFSGIRNSIAVACSISSLYLVFYKKKWYSIAIILYFMACTTHQMVLILVPTVIVGLIKKHQWAFRILALCAMPIIFEFSKFIFSLPSETLQNLATRVLFYTDHAYGSDRPEMIANIAIFLAIALSHYLLSSEGVFSADTCLQKGYWNSYCFLGCIMIGCVPRRDFTLRMGYIMGIAAIPILCRLLFRINGQTLHNKNYRLILLLLSFGLVVCCSKVYYDCWYTMSRWVFFSPH